MRKGNSTKVWPLKYEQLLHTEDHDFAVRLGFGVRKTDLNVGMPGSVHSLIPPSQSPVPVGIDIQIESVDSISEVNMGFTMTFYLRHYWKDERLSFPSTTSKSTTFDHRLIKKIWVSTSFFVHSQRSLIPDTTVENSMLRIHPDGNILFSLRITVSAICFLDVSRFPLDTQNCPLHWKAVSLTPHGLHTWSEPTTTNWHVNQAGTTQLAYPSLAHFPVDCHVRLGVSPTTTTPAIVHSQL
nr:LOW QUALITY PROTEIN: gamma-aminobutyric acid receptor subunit rho-3 [Desmodus rotundus]